ncbi:MAG: hypothetical protein GY822_19635 [Deltaproteobacteria bacterium]|nr:hypothetical protein [Deltaproteobacteria bacterium]
MDGSTPSPVEASDVITDVSEDHLEALQEIMNVAIGRSSSSLATLLDVFMVMTVPNIRLVPAKDLHALLLTDEEEHFLVEQVFHGDFSGQGLTVFPRSGLNNMLELILPPDEVESLGKEQAEREVLLEIGNLVMSATAGTCAELLKGNLTFSAPHILPITSLRDALAERKDQMALVMETNIETENEQVAAVVALVQDAAASKWLLGALDAFLDELFG